MQVPQVSLGQRRLSVATLLGDPSTDNEMHRFGSVPSNLQTFPYQNIASFPMYNSPYPYSIPGRPLSVTSTYPYQIPRHLSSHTPNPQMNWGRRTSAFYPAPSPDPSEYLYTHRPFVRSASLPPQSIKHLDSPLKGQKGSINSVSQISNGKNNVEKVQLANKIDLEEITLSKKSQDAYIGLNIELLPESLDQDVVVVVQRVTFGGLCHKDGRIKRGDRILKVNGYRVKDFDKTIENLRQPNVTLTVARITREFKREHLRPITCSLFGYKPAFKPSKSVTAFPKGTPRLVKGVDEAKLEVEMISLCRRLGKVRTGSKKTQWHIYNVDKQEYISGNKDNHTIRKHQKKATKQQGEAKKQTPKGQHIDTQHKVLDKPLGKKPTTPLKAPNHSNTSNSMRMPVFRPAPIVQPYRYWVPAVPTPHFNPMIQMQQAPFSYPPYPNGGIFPQRMGYPRTRHSTVPDYFRQGKESGSLKRSPIEQRSSNAVEETLL